MLRMNELQQGRRVFIKVLRIMTLSFYSQQRTNMIDGQIRIAGVSDERLIDAFNVIPREDFLPEQYRHVAYTGENLDLGEGRCFIDPALYGRLVQAANLQPDSRVLDIGCLSGYSTAILGSLSSHVYGVDDQQWVMKAKKIAESTGLAMQDFYIGTLNEGAPDLAPFDIIVINGAIEFIPQALLDQLNEGGIIASFWRDHTRDPGRAVLHRKHNNMLDRTILFDAFVPVLAGFEKEEGFVF